MFGKYKISLVMPAKNEGDVVSTVLARTNTTEETGYDEVIVVANDCTDDTCEEVRKFMQHNDKIKLIEDNRTTPSGGYGYAIQTGLAAATGDYVVVCDCDGTYASSMAVGYCGFISHMVYDGIEFATCSRYPDRSIPFMLRFGVQILTQELRLLYGIPITDALSGMMIFSRHAIEVLDLTEPDWNFSVEAKVKAWLMFGPDKWREYQTWQLPRMGDETKQAYWQTGLSHLAWIAKYRMSDEAKMGLRAKKHIVNVKQ